MAALSFMSSLGLGAKVKSGEKYQTIRWLRANPVKIEDRLSFWQDQRSPKREKLGESFAHIVLRTSIEPGFNRVCVGNRKLTDQELEVFAIADGFEDPDRFFAFFSRQLKQKSSDCFLGQLIVWDHIHDDETGETRLCDLSKTIPLWDLWDYGSLWQWLKENDYPRLKSFVQHYDHGAPVFDEMIWAIAKEYGIHHTVKELIPQIIPI